MVTQIVSNTGWFGRIGESIKGILFGILLVIVALAVLVFNERNAIRDIQANKEIAAAVVSVASDRVDAASDGALVHLNGRATTDDRVTNGQFGVDENAIRLSWAAQIYQWVEKEESETKKKLGGGEETVKTYSYERKWVTKLVDSSDFVEAGHENGKTREFRGGSSQAETVTLGAFHMPPALVSKISASEGYPLSELPDALAQKGSIVGGVFHTGDPGKPEIGDEKVEFSITRPTDVTVMAVQTGETFRKYVAKNGKERFLLYDGLLTAEQVVEEEKGKAKFLRWILRGVGLLLMFFGFSLIFRPLSVLADVVPIFGSFVGGATGLIAFLLAFGISAVVMAISWVAFRPLIGIPLLVLGVGAIVWFVMKLVRGRGIQPPQPPQPI